MSKKFRLAAVWLGVATMGLWGAPGTADGATSYSNGWISMSADNSRGIGYVTDKKAFDDLVVEGQFGNNQGGTQTIQANGGSTSRVLSLHVRAVQGCWKNGPAPWNWDCSGWK